MAIFPKVFSTSDVEYYDMTYEEDVRTRYLVMRDHLDERGRRMFAATEVQRPESKGTASVSRATGLARSTIGRGIKELENPLPPTTRIRREGAGRPPLTQVSPGLCEDLRKLVEHSTLGDPMRPLKWVSKSFEKLAAALVEMGYKISATTVGKLLVNTLDYRRQVNRKVLEGCSHPDRDAQFKHISDKVTEFQALGLPAISVDTKKKEHIGPFKNAGSDYRPAKCPDAVRTHDFIDKDLGKAVPHGIYDIHANEGWVTVGVDADTAEFAVNSLRLWWEKMGSSRYPAAKRLHITADGGGSNGSRTRLWKRELQHFADETGISVSVSHYPPGTSKWNRVEHRLFCHITQNWRGRPLTSRLAIVELIAATTTTTGLTVRCELDTRSYEKGIKVSNEEFETLKIEYNTFHPEWNYTFSPRTPSPRTPK